MKDLPPTHLHLQVLEFDHFQSRGVRPSNSPHLSRAAFVGSLRLRGSLAALFPAVLDGLRPSDSLRAPAAKTTPGKRSSPTPLRWRLTRYARSGPSGYCWRTATDGCPAVARPRLSISITSMINPEIR